MNEKKNSKANNCGGLKTSMRCDVQRCANIKKASQDEQQNQTTATTKFNYIKNFMSVLKNKT